MIAYLGENCPKCGDYRVMPIKVNEKQVGGHCMKCSHRWTCSEERTKELKEQVQKMWKEYESEKGDFHDSDCDTWGWM